MQVRAMVAGKSGAILDIDAQATCLEASAKMVEHGVGALVVRDSTADKGVAGLITERALVRRLAKGQTANATVAEAMERRLIWVREDEDSNRCMALVTAQRKRYLLVEGANGCLTGLISIGDIVKCQLADQQFLIEQLGSYMGDVPTPAQGIPIVKP
ncbi:MAG: CBS domain-containing protein [Planctomycetota bacterium]|jgi:CBS domain-containing protein|nr:CBS domain-containing protein [Planctomycetota bacterium]